MRRGFELAFVHLESVAFRLRRYACRATELLPESVDGSRSQFVRRGFELAFAPREDASEASSAKWPARHSPIEPGAALGGHSHRCAHSFHVIVRQHVAKVLEHGNKAIHLR